MLVTEETTHDLLAHLADSAYLEDHPLAGVMPPEGVQKGQALRVLLLDAIERLKPPEGTPADDPAWRPFEALRSRFVELRTPLRVQEALGLSERQVRREQRRGIAALASLLTDALAAQEGAEPDGAAGDALRAAAEAIRANPAPLDVLLLLREMERLWAPRLAACGASLLLPAAATIVYADRMTLRQVLLRLLSSLASLGTGARIGAEVSEAGSEVDLCFELDVGEGKGLADDILAECNYLAELSLGRVWQGCESGRLRLHCALPARAPLLFLVVDDEQAAPRLIGRCVQGYSVRVAAVSDPQRALQEASELAPDVIALDVLMPGRDGWEVLQQLKSSPETHDIPVIVCSVWKEPELALSLGASAFIRKPVTRPLLLQALGRVLPSESAARFRPA